MPQVYTGKVLIPGDQIEAYFAARKEAEEARAPFRQSLEALNDDFAVHLAAKYSKRTVNKHTGTVDLFIHFLCDYTDVERLEDVTRGMVNSHFRSWCKRKVLYGMDSDDIRVALRKFFQFLDQEKGIHNQRALEALR
jgi:site-specific recombinase XerD